jgi:hypothetical protein
MFVSARADEADFLCDVVSFRGIFTRVLAAISKSLSKEQVVVCLVDSNSVFPAFGYGVTAVLLCTVYGKLRTFAVMFGSGRPITARPAEYEALTISPLLSNGAIDLRV